MKRLLYLLISIVFCSCTRYTKTVEITYLTGEVDTMQASYVDEFSKIYLSGEGCFGDKTGILCCGVRKYRILDNEVKVK